MDPSSNNGNGTVVNVGNIGDGNVINIGNTGYWGSWAEAIAAAATSAAGTVAGAATSAAGIAGEIVTDASNRLAQQVVAKTTIPKFDAYLLARMLTKPSGIYGPIKLGHDGWEYCLTSNSSIARTVTWQHHCRELLIHGLNPGPNVDIVEIYAVIVRSISDHLMKIMTTANQMIIVNNLCALMCGYSGTLEYTVWRGILRSLYSEDMAKLMVNNWTTSNN